MIDILEKDILRIRKRLKELEVDLDNLESYEHKLKKDVRQDIVRFEGELTSKQRLIHQVRQDYEVHNIESEVRVDKLLGQGGEVEDLSSVIEDIYGPEGYLGEEEEVDLD